MRRRKFCSRQKPFDSAGISPFEHASPRLADVLLNNLQTRMKALIIFGAIVGFLIGAGFGMASSSPWPATLWRSCAAALVATILTRWWSRVWLQGLRDSLNQRRTRRPSSTPFIQPVKKL